MLRISKKADYAIFLLGAIARQGAYRGGSAADTVVSAQEIARQAGLNKSVVANLLKEFSRHGLLESVRGLRGGYRLARPPSEISLGQILEVVEGKFVLVDCVPHEPISFPPISSPLSSSPLSSSPLSSSPLSKAASQAAVSQPTAAAAGSSSKHHAPSSSHDCSLIGFCPSKHPMRIVHQRINKLFAEIHLDELCAMTPLADTAGHSTPRTTARTSPRTTANEPTMAGTNPAAASTKHGN